MTAHDSIDAQALHRLAEAVRAACVQVALDGFEQASVDGLCCEGAWECGVEAIRSLNIDALVREITAQADVSHSDSSMAH